MPLSVSFDFLPINSLGLKSEQDLILKKIKINPDIKYCVDVFDVKLFDADRKKTTVLSDPEAVVWALIANRYSLQKIYRLLAIIGRMTPNHAKSVVDDALRFFYAENLLLGD